MTNFSSRYKNLNAAQKQAVDTIDGPLLVIAGPGTGKTELLSMRTANILQKTDTLPENILCLTFTDSGATAMRERLSQIIGPAAYKVAIHTFHSFGTEVINQNNQYFYQGANFKPADELAQYEILTSIFDELDYTNPLASKLGDEYTHRRDAARVISELKQAGLTSDELLAIIQANETVLDAVEPDLMRIFGEKISTTMLTHLVPLAQKVAALVQPNLPPGITPLANVLALSMAHAFDAAVETGKTNALTAWRNQWMEKNESGEFVFKDRKRYIKLRAMSHVYYSYLTRMEQAGLYDYDDMILNVIHAMELHKDLSYNLQEKYHYILVDEFQDTNLAQLRILFDLTSSVTGDAPNIMAVGDDDQAIYSFQGADVNNIHRFAAQYPGFHSIVLTDNYRSASTILESARTVITQGGDRLEQTMGLNKKLTAHASPDNPLVSLHELSHTSNERSWIAKKIKERIAAGTAPDSIAILARRHQELIALAPYLVDAGIPIRYERRENILDSPVVQTLELIARVVVAIAESNHSEANSQLPELLAHPMYGFTPESIWRLSITSARNHLSWLETMIASTEFKPFSEWLITQAASIAREPLELVIDRLIGLPSDTVGDEVVGFRSPFYHYYFGEESKNTHAQHYIEALESLRTMRDHLREYKPDQLLLLTDLLDFIDAHRQLGTRITSVQRINTADAAVQLMTAHKSKGLEFDHIYVIGAIDSAWGERVRSRSRLIGYPANLPLAPSGGSYDERLRLFYVAMTRAKQSLTVTYSAADDLERTQLLASFLTDTGLHPIKEVHTKTTRELVQDQEIAWHDRLTAHPTASMHDLVRPILDTYKLSITHLNNFIDISRGGPTHFLLSNLLRFPQAKSANAAYGTVIHRTLQKAHNHLSATGERRPVEDVLGDFVAELHDQHLSRDDELLYAKRGADSLNVFLRNCYDGFLPGQKTELNFANQGVVINEARLTGALDVVTLEGQEIVVTDYKTGKPSRDWQGKTDWEKIKLHKYRQQLMFYQLLTEHSRDYSKYDFQRGVLQFVEPDAAGRVHALDASFTREELADFAKLIGAVWQSIMKLDFPDISDYDPTYKGILQFEADLIDKYGY